MSSRSKDGTFHECWHTANVKSSLTFKSQIFSEKHKLVNHSAKSQIPIFFKSQFFIVRSQIKS